MSILVNGELVLTGFVGDSFFYDGFTSTQVIEALAEVGFEEDLTVRLNSGGGYAYEGIAIYNALKNHGGKVTIYIDAVAASAASIIAMAGDDIVIRLGASFMIHDPAGGAYGTKAALQKVINSLDNLAKGMASIYAGQSGESREKILKDMEAEIWLSGEEAVARGYATSSEEVDAAQATAFDYSLYASAPAHLTSLAAQEGWKITAHGKPEKPQSKPQSSTQETPPMGTNPGKDGAGNQPAASDEDPKARIQAILQSDAATANMQLAQHLAFNTDLTSQKALDTLAAATPQANSGDGNEPEGKGEDDTSTNVRAYEQLRSTAKDLADPAPNGGAGKGLKADLNIGNIYASRRTGADS